MITATAPRPAATGAGENHKYPEVIRIAIAERLNDMAQRQRELSDELDTLNDEIRELFREHEA